MWLTALRAVGILALTLWGALVLWFYPWPLEGLRYVLPVAWAVLGGLTLLWWRRGTARGRLVAGLYGLAAVAIVLAWTFLRPSHDRLWADDVSRLLSGEAKGSVVHLENVRRFAWRAETDYTPRWGSAEYDLDQITGADLILSYWMGPHIAHSLVSFEFADGRHLVFSMEIRKERHESFSAIGGFFRQYEQIIVAAEEDDILRTRSNARGEEVFLYRLRASPEHLRALFLDYVDAANQLVQQPSFYNTLTSNCTTIIYELARKTLPGLPLDLRLLASGHFAEYAYELGGLVPGYSYEALRQAGHVNARAQEADQTGEDYSTAIRRGVPGIPPASSKPPASGTPDLSAVLPSAPTSVEGAGREPRA